MKSSTRRQFLDDLGRGMMTASVGCAVADQLGLSPAFAEEGSTRLTFGKLEPLVSLIQDTPPKKLQPLLIEKLKAGATDLGELTAAAGLANARCFGGDDYVGFHALMAMVPAYEMSRELAGADKPLPVLKVIYRSAGQIQRRGGRPSDTLAPIAPIAATAQPQDKQPGLLLRDAVRANDVALAERIFAAQFANKRPTEAEVKEIYNHLQYSVQDDVNVHRVVLAHRAWSLIDLVGMTNAHTMLRQSVRNCISNRGGGTPIRKILPKLLDKYRLVGRPLGKRKAEDAWIERMSETVYKASRAEAADAVAGALAEGISPEDVGHALSLAANAAVLHDRHDRTHGASVGVHSSDAVLAWRSIARVTNARNTVASLIVAAYHVASGGAHVIGGPASGREPYPLAEHLEAVKATKPDTLLREAETAIRANDQQRACAAIHRYGQRGYPPRPVFDLMLRYAVSEDGRLHGEKYYRTVVEEYATARPAFRWRQLVALTRVTASAYGYDARDRPGRRAPGYEEARRLLNV